jgi:murein DD-endopeptidase MepM/ murein hydrolase activator NlpD
MTWLAKSSRTFGLSFLRMLLSCALLACFSFLPYAHAAHAWAVQVQPSKLVNGGPILFQVKAPVPLASLSGSWLDHPITFSFDAASKIWTAFAGVSIETAPGTYTLNLTGERAHARTGDSRMTFSRKLTVTRAKYPRTKAALTVEGKFTAPSPEQMQQIDESKKIKEDYLNRVTLQREWSGKFTEPAHAAISDVFGSARIFNNGKTSSPHQGLDFRVPTGTPIAAMNAGTVLLARPLYYEGNFIVIDHGQGLLTLYLHLSEFKVKEGDRVERGQEIGLSGGTGRATGPHLHVAVRWQGVYLDPARLLQLALP